MSAPTGAEGSGSEGANFVGGVQGTPPMERFPFGSVLGTPTQPACP